MSMSGMLILSKAVSEETGLTLLKREIYARKQVDNTSGICYRP